MRIRCMRAYVRARMEGDTITSMKKIKALNKFKRETKEKHDPRNV